MQKSPEIVFLLLIKFAGTTGRGKMLRPLQQIIQAERRKYNFVALFVENGEGGANGRGKVLHVENNHCLDSENNLVWFKCGRGDEKNRITRNWA